MTKKILKPRGQVKIEPRERIKFDLLQKKWGWSHQDLINYLFKLGLRTAEVNKFPEVGKDEY